MQRVELHQPISEQSESPRQASQQEIVSGTALMHRQAKRRIVDSLGTVAKKPNS